MQQGPSPAPFPDMRANNARLRDKLKCAVEDFYLIQQRINEGQVKRTTTTVSQGEREALAAINAELKHDES
ncbi:hypothetical protein [Ochrobactrum sp. SFR4]|uniref:hypothetical protein n=1 Tax=Ochrobactrum sp. SFR4 TaxID=2717368 RepID=UPI001C8C02C3|nr:hypothetical protein [Ochrobactrum sp. SFR4]MBX8827335.1 hypothetical protein [Ochrobactrum sp. SFR4]